MSQKTKKKLLSRFIQKKTIPEIFVENKDESGLTYSPMKTEEQKFSAVFGGTFENQAEQKTFYNPETINPPESDRELLKKVMWRV